MKYQNHTKIVLCFFFFLFGGCSSVAEKLIVHEARKVLDCVDGEEMSVNEEKKDDEVSKKLFELNSMVKALELAQSEIEKQKNSVHHQGHIQIHQYYIQKNHLSEAKKAKIEAEIEWHKKELEKLNLPAS